LSQADSIQTDLAAWKKAEGDFSLLQGDWSRTASWITAFGPMGEAVEGVRLTRENFKADLGPGGYHTRLESFKNEFDSSGKNIVKTTVTGSELGRSSVNGETALVSKFDQTVTTVLDGKFDVLGRALREKRVTTENGQTTTTEDIEDRQYGTHPRTHQNIVSSTGEMSTVLWEGVLNAAGQTVRFNRKTTRGTTVTEESSNEDSRYEQGRLVYENTHTKETKSGLVTEWDSVEKTKEFDVFGRVSRAEVTTTRSTLLGRKVTTENRTYGYDAYGRLSSTDVIGTETVGGAVRQINTRQETLSFYADGRARKTRSISREGEVVTTRLTQGEIRYDKEGNVVESLEKVRQQGPHLDKTYTDGFTDARYDPQGRQIGVKQIRIDGSLKTERTVVNKKFNADNQAVEFDVTVSEMSLDSSLAHAKTYRESTTGATYDRFGNMQSYVKGDNADGIRKTRTPVAGFDQYDNQGRLLQSMVEVKDELGKIHYELVFGVGFNSDGLQSSSVTVNFTTRQGSPSSEAVEALQRMYARGELSSESLNRDNGAQLGADLSPFVKARTEIQNVRDIYPWRGRVTSSVTKSVLVGGITNIEISTQPRLEYDRQGRVINAPGVSVSLAWDDNGVLIKHNATTMPENRTLMFDSLNRAVLTRKTTTSSAQTTTTTSILTYQPNGRLATQTDHISERGAINKTHSQLTTFTYDSWGRVTDQLTKSYHDSTSPDKVAYFRKIVSNFDPKGNALKYVTESWDNTSVDKERKEYSGARYDNAGNLIFVNRVKTFKEAPGGLRTLVSLDQHVVNTYTKKGELVKTEYTRYWGEELAKFADGGKYQTSNGGGGVDGLDEGWTSGNAKVSTRYEYDPSTGHMSAMYVTANGTGKHSNGEIQALGIQLTYSQTDIKYNNAGQVTGYHQVVKQIEHYCYYKQSQKGLKRKVKTVWTTGMLTTESDVQVLEYDSYGRQIHTVTTSQQNDPSQTWTRTESKIKSFDDHGRVKDVTRTTDSRLTLVKKKGSWFKTFLALHVMLIDPVVGMAMLASTSLGGQKIYSHNVVDQTMAYDQDGQVDKDKTKTSTLEENSYMQGKNFGDKVMMACDIMVAVAAVVVSIIFPPLAVVMAAVLMIYNSMRQGISTHDLGMFGKNSDRGEEGKKNRKRFWTDAAMVVIAWLAAPAKGAQAAKTAQQVVSTGNTINQGVRAGQMVNTLSKVHYAVSRVINFNRVTQILWRAATQVAVAGINGADKKTFALVAALSVVDGAMGGGAGGGNGGNWQQAAFVGGGELVRQVGVNFGKEKQRSTWMIAGGAIQGMSGEVSNNGTVSGNGIASGASSSLTKSFLLQKYSQKNSGDASNERDQTRNGLVMQALGNAFGTLLGNGVKLYENRQVENKAVAMGISPAQYSELAYSQRESKTTLKSILSNVASGLLSPFKAVAGFVMGLTPTANQASTLAAQRNVNLEVRPKSADFGEPMTVFEMQNGARVTCALDANGQPMLVKGSVLEFNNARMSVENQEYLSGRFVSDGSRWQLEGEGVMVANSFKGLKREDGGILPITVIGRAGSVEPTGVDWGLVPVGMAMKVSDVPTRVNGIGVVYAGTFIHAGNGRAVWAPGSNYQGEGASRPTMVYSDRGTLSLLDVVEMRGNMFVVQLKNVALGDGNALNFDNVRIPGRIENGVGVLAGEIVRGTAHLLGQFGKASGFVDVRPGVNGFELVGALKGHVALREREDRAVMADRPSGAGRELPAGQFTVMGKVRGYYHLLGEKIPVTERGIEPFTVNTEFRVAAGAYLRMGPLDYRQNESTGYFKVLGNGSIKSPFKAAVRDFGAHTLSVIGVDGNAESVVHFNNLWQPISAKTAGGMTEGVKPVERGGKKGWVIEGLGQHDIFVEMTAQERAGNGGAVRGLTTAERYAKKAMVFCLSYVTPVPMSEKTAAVLVESSAHTSTTLAGNVLGFGRNLSILAGVGADQLGLELLGKHWEKFGQDRAIRVFGWVSEKLDSAKITLELVNTDRMVGLGGAARDNQLTMGQVVGAMSIGSLGDFAAGFVTMSPLGGKSMEHYEKAYSGNAWTVMKAAVKDIVEPIYESFTYASSNGTNPADRGVVAKFYGLGEGESQPSAVDVYGPEVALGLAVGNTLNVGVMTGGMLYGGLKGGVKAFKEEVGVVGDSYGRLNVLQRLGRATVHAGLEVGKDVVIQTVDQIVPGVAGKAVDFAEQRTAALKVLEFRQIEKNLGISDMAGVNVYDRVGNKVILEIHGRDGQTPDLPELIRRLGESTQGNPIDIQIGFSDPEMAKSVGNNRELLNLFDQNGIKNLHDLAKFERGVATQRRGLYERAEKEYQGLVQVKEQAVLKLDGAIAEGRTRLAELTELRDNRGRMEDDAFIAKVKSLVGDWDSAGADPRSAGSLSGRETNQRPNSEGLGRPSEKIRPGPEGPGGDRKAGDSAADRYSEIQRRAERYAAAGRAETAAGRAETAAGRAETAAGRALDYEISGTENKIREFGQERSRLQQEISVFNGRAERAGAGTRRYGERIQRIDEHLQFLEERLKYLENPAVAKNLKITVTSAWREGDVRPLGFLDDWAQDRKAQPLDGTYAPNPYTKIPKGNFLNDFYAEHPDVRELHEARLNQGLSPPESVVLVTVRENLAGAESLVRGIDPWRLKGEGNRFDQAVYFAEEIETGLMETIGEKGNPSHAAQFEFNVGEARALDLRDKALAAEFGYEPEKWTDLSKDEVYQKTHEVHHRARMAGYDTIVYESTKNPGHTAYAVIDHFDTLLKPAKESVRPVDPSQITAARQSLAAGVVVSIDGKGNVTNVVAPTKTPRAQSPPLNKATSSRAGPQAQDLGSMVKEVQLSEELKSSVIQKAQRWQGQGEYPGVDNYRVIVLKKGTKVYGGEPGQTEFYTTAKTLEKYGNDSRSIYGALQVKPKNDLFRPGLTEYLLKEDTVVAVGITRANPQWGVGGATQIYIEKFKDVLQPTKTFLLKNRKAQ
jgi:hypothetical protein